MITFEAAIYYASVDFNIPYELASKKCLVLLLKHLKIMVHRQKNLQFDVFTCNALNLLEDQVSDYKT